MKRPSILACCALLVSCNDPEQYQIVGSSLENCQRDHAVLDKQGRVRLEALGTNEVITHGTIICDYKIAQHRSVTSVSVRARDVPMPQDQSPYSWWPTLTTDVITQVRFRRADGSYSPWEPRNVLDGGDFADSNSNGIPDDVNVLVGDADQNWSIYADTQTIGPRPPDFWLPPERILNQASLVDASDHPEGLGPSLHIHKPWMGGQQLASMATALLPPDATWTVSGWNRFEKMDAPDLMARFHEHDSTGASLTKYVLLGDDDFHAPNGRSGWTWRALSFTSEPRTAGLMLIPARLTASPGDMWASAFEIREGSVFSSTAPTLFQADFGTLDAWEVSDPAVTTAVRVGVGSIPALQISPTPGQVVTAVQRTPVPVREGALYAFQIAMENRASPSYDPTHETWVSCYLEFFDESMKFLEYAKVQVFRPVLDRPAAAATIAPAGARYARFFLAALHKTYDGNELAGSMVALFSRLTLQESSYDPTFRARSRTTDIVPGCTPDAVAIQIRSRLLTRDRTTTPSLAGFDIQTGPHCTP